MSAPQSAGELGNDGAASTLLFDCRQRSVSATTASARLLGIADSATTIGFDAFLAHLGEHDGAALAEALRSVGADAATLDTRLHPRTAVTLALQLQPIGVATAGLVLGTLSSAADVLQPSAVADAATISDSTLANAAPHTSLAVLAGGVAHDFNNLLVGVMGNLDLARYADDVSADTQRHLEAALAAAERAAELCRQLFAFSGLGPVRTVLKDVNQELRRIAPLLRQAVPRSVQLTLLPSDGALPALLDSGLFVQLLLNLLNNALDAGGPKGRIRVESRLTTVPGGDLPALRWFGHAPPPGRYVSLVVSDNGPGMSETLQERIFEPLFTTRGEGRGLGLPAVAGIVRQHGGSIGVRSALHLGTDVVVLLPEAPPSTAQTVRAPQRRREGTVLIVDDESTVRDVLRLQLERLGYRTSAAENGQVALAYLQQHANELLAIVLDQTMPVMGGGETYRRLRELTPALPVVLTSGYGEESLLELIERDPHAAFLPKPFSLGRLREVLERVVG